MQQQWDDWYWTIGGKSGVYSSKRNIYVPETDDEYEAWRARNPMMEPPNVPTEADVWFYVQNYLPLWVWNGTTMSQPGAGQYTKDQLVNYNGLARFAKVDGGMVAAGVPVKTDERSRNFIQGGRMLAEADPDWTTKWLGSDGNIYDVDAAQMIEMSTVVGTHTNQCYLVFDQVNTGVTLGSITTTAQIDTAYAGL